MAKLFLSFLSVCFFFLPLTSNAENVSVNDIWYSLNSKNLTAEVVQSQTAYQGAVVVPSAFAYDGSTYTVVSIAAKAFAGSSSLTSISIPSSIVQIGKEAFRSCSGLTAVHITDVAAWCAVQFGDYDSNPLVYAHNLYLNGSLLEHLTVPAQVETIGGRAFSGCTALKTVTLSYGVASVGDYAFSNCSNLATLSFPATLTSIGDGAFSFCSSISSLQMPSGLQTVESSAFYGCSGLTAVHITDLAAWCNIRFADNKANPLVNAGRLYLNNTEVTQLTIPAGVSVVGNYAFSDCYNLTSLTIPEGVTSIGHGAFSGCTSLSSLVFPQGLSSIGEGAFMFCNSLLDMTFPANILSVGKDAFSGCLDLKAVHTQDLTSWCQSDFANYNSNPLFYAQYFYHNGEEITDLIIPEGTVSVGSHAFAGYTRLASVVFASSVTSISNGAFSGCTSLSPTVVLPDNLSHIGENAFANCTGLYYITFPSGFVTLDRDAFIGCSNMKTVCCLAEIVPETHANAFDHATIGSISLYVPEGCVGYYLREAPWNKFAQILPYVAESMPYLSQDVIPVMFVQGATLCIQGLPAGQQVRLYTSQGKQLAASATSGESTFSMELPDAGNSILLVEVADRCWKIVVP